MPPRSIGRLLAQEHPSRTGFCTWCQQPVQKPRRTWCSDECVEEYQIRANPQVVRQKLVARDKEVCGACGLDCRWLADLMERLKRLGPVHCEESVRLLRWSVIESKPRTPIEPSATLSPEIAAFLSEDRSERQCYIGQDRRGYSVFLTCRGWGRCRRATPRMVVLSICRSQKNPTIRGASGSATRRSGCRRPIRCDCHSGKRTTSCRSSKGVGGLGWRTIRPSVFGVTAENRLTTFGGSEHVELSGASLPDIGSGRGTRPGRRSLRSWCRWEASLGPSRAPSRCAASACRPACGGFGADA